MIRNFYFNVCVGDKNDLDALSQLFDGIEEIERYYGIEFAMTFVNDVPVFASDFDNWDDPIFVENDGKVVMAYRNKKTKKITILDDWGVLFMGKYNEDHLHEQKEPFTHLKIQKVK